MRLDGTIVRAVVTRTTQGGGAVDIGYHSTVLPLLLLTFVVLLRRRDQATS